MRDIYREHQARKAAERGERTTDAPMVAPVGFVYDVDECDLYGLGRRTPYEPGRPFVPKLRKVQNGPRVPSHASPPPRALHYNGLSGRFEATS